MMFEKVASLFFHFCSVVKTINVAILVPCTLCYDFEIFFLRNCFLIVGHLSSIGHAKVLCTQIKQTFLVKQWKILSCKSSSKLLIGIPQHLSRLFNVEIFCDMFPLKNYKVEIQLRIKGIKDIFSISQTGPSPIYIRNPSYPLLPWQVSILLVPAASTYTTISIQKARPWLVIYMLSAFLYFHFKGHQYASAFKAAVVNVDPALGRFAMQWRDTGAATVPPPAPSLPSWC